MSKKTERILYYLLLAVILAVLLLAIAAPLIPAHAQAQAEAPRVDQPYRQYVPAVTNTCGPWQHSVNGRCEYMED